MSSPSWSARWMSLVMGLLVRRVHQRFEAQTRDAARVNADTLRAILHNHRDTVFGREHGLGALRTVADYQRALPLREYAFFQPYVERIARGEQRVLGADPVEYLGVTSGTTGQSKRHSVTRRQLQLLRDSMLIGRARVAQQLPAARRPAPAMLLMNSYLRERTEGGQWVGSLSALSVDASLRGRFPPPFLSPPAVFQLRKHPDALYLHTLFGLRERGLGSIAAPFASGLVDLMNLLTQQGATLMEDIARGMPRADLELEPGTRQLLEARLEPRPERAREIAQAMEGGVQGLARRLWPQLAYTSSITGASFSLYARALEPFLEGVPMYPATYLSTEATLGVALGVGPPHYCLLPGAAFFEFIPEAHLDETAPPVLLPEQLVEGEVYELVLTTWAGLYRYRMGDVVRVVGRHHQSPLLEVLYRRGTLLNMMGEKTSEHATHQALEEVLGAQRLPLSDYSVVEDTRTMPGRYAFFVEFPRSEAPPAEAEALGEALDAALQRANPFYGVMRAGERLGAATVHPVAPGTFQALREVLVRRGGTATQVKVPRVARDPELRAVLWSHVVPRGG